jgi:hypothetical protein
VKPTYIALFDFKKKPLTLWTETNYGLSCQARESQHISVQQFRETYMEYIVRVNTGNGISEDFRVITQGVRQGRPLSPVLFNLYLDETKTQ